MIHTLRQRRWNNEDWWRRRTDDLNLCNIKRISSASMFVKRELGTWQSIRWHVCMSMLKGPCLIPRTVVTTSLYTSINQWHTTTRQTSSKRWSGEGISWMTNSFQYWVTKVLSIPTSLFSLTRDPQNFLNFNEHPYEREKSWDLFHPWVDTSYGYRARHVTLLCSFPW